MAGATLSPGERAAARDVLGRGFARRAPELRRTLELVIAREGMGLGHVEVLAAREGALARRARDAKTETESMIADLRDLIRLVDFIAAGGSWPSDAAKQGEAR